MKKILLLITISFLGTYLHAQLSITGIGSPETIDFTGFAGAGFQPGGGAGMLNSDTWSATGFSDGELDFGETSVSGDFARGTTMGLVTTGGIYGVDILGNQGLMVQPVDGDFTPGSFILKMQNNTGEEIGSFDITYTVYILNDANRANSFNLSYSYDNITWFNVPAADYISPEAADFTPYMTNISATISALSIVDGALFYLSWTGNDVGGAGTRDEFAIDDINITAGAYVPLPTYNFDITEVTVNEGDLEGTFDVTVSESTDCVINFGYGVGATATPGFDYGLTGFTLEFFAGGPTSQTVIYGLVDDLTAEGTETGIIMLASAEGACVAGTDTTFVITIEDNELVTPPIASFTTIGATEDESIGTVTGTIELTESADCILQMYLDGATTMTEGSDYIFSLPVEFTFTSGGATTQTFDVSINDDVEIESTEMLLMNLTTIAGACAIGAIADFEININDNDATPPTYTVYDIAEVTTEDVDGNAVSDGELVDLTGIVYGVNLWDGGLQFTLIDNTAGISVFSFDNDFGYTVVEGDEVNILGAINQFNGLTEVDADTLIFVDGGNSLQDPALKYNLDESTESDLILLDMDGYYFVDESQWLGDGTSFNVEFTDGINTMIIRIDDNTELSTKTLLEIGYTGIGAYIDVTGIGSQYDTDAPYSSGYQLMPRYVSDFTIIYNSITALDPSQINIYPNPTTNNITLSGKENILSLEIIDNMGRTVEILEINNFEKTISVLDLPAGFYGLKIKTETGIYASGFIKQ